MSSRLTLIAALALTILAFLAGKGCSPKPEIRTDSVFVVHERTDTIAVPHLYVQKLQGKLRRDTVIRIQGDTVFVLADAGSFAVDSVVGSDTVHAEVSCDSAQIRNLWIRHAPVYVTVHDTLRDVRRVVAVEHQNTLSASIFAECDLLKLPTEGFHLSSFGAIGNMALGPLQVYLQPSFDFGFVDCRLPAGLSLSLGVSYTLFER